MCGRNSIDNAAILTLTLQRYLGLYQHCSDPYIDIAVILILPFRRYLYRHGSIPYIDIAAILIYLNENEPCSVKRRSMHLKKTKQNKREGVTLPL